MLDKLLYGAGGRALRGALAGLTSKVLLVPFIAKMPGAAEFLQNKDMHAYVVGAIMISLMALAKGLRDRGKIPAWIPL